MKARRYRAFQALLLALTGFFLLERVWSGKILLYINQRYVLLVLLAAVGLIILSQVVLRERKKEAADTVEAEHDGPYSGANLAWLAIPLLVGVIIPARSLGTSAIAARGVEISSPFNLQGNSGATALERPSTQRTVLDWIRAFHAAANPASLNGEAVDVIGFVYHDPRLKADQFLIGRYTVACCIADATAIGISVQWAAAAGLQNNQWVRVQGKLAAGDLEGQVVPTIEAAEVTAIPEPDQPYIFP